MQYKWEQADVRGGRHLTVDWYAAMITIYPGGDGPPTYGIVFINSGKVLVERLPMKDMIEYLTEHNAKPGD